MRTWIVLLLAVFLLMPASAQAQNEITLETLKVGLWSEYDQPSMLVIYDFNVSPNTSLPTSVELRIPGDANITAVAFQQGADLLNTEFAGPVKKGTWQVITLFINEPVTYHVEYYQPLNRDGNQRSFEYQWPDNYAIKDFRVEVQLPGDATAIKSTPAIPFTPRQSFMSGSTSVNDLKAGTAYTLNVNYTRTADETVRQPSASSPVTAEPITQSTAGRVTLDNLPYALGLVGVVLIAGAIYYFWQTNSNQASVKPRRRNNKSSDDKVQIHCHECGTRANAEDQFCRVCGTKLRK